MINCDQRKPRETKKKTDYSTSRLKKNKRKSHNKHNSVKKKKSTWMNEIKLLSASFLLVILLTTVLFFLTNSLGKMNGYSMLPEVSNGDVFTVTKVNKIKRFDLVYMKVPHKNGQKSVRRIIGLPGDTLYFKNDELYINNEGKNEKYLNSLKNQLSGGLLTEDFSLDDLTGKDKVPQNSYFVLGDNRQSSMDSREYGFVEANQIVGKVGTKVFPFTNLKSYR